MLNAFFKARPRLRVALLGLAICAPSMAVGVSAALAQDAARLAAPATTPFVSDRLSVEVIGQGPDVILIPGFGCSREVWRATAERLKATHRVHLVQLAGFAGEPGATATEPSSSRSSTNWTAMPGPRGWSGRPWSATPWAR